MPHGGRGAAWRLDLGREGVRPEQPGDTGEPRVHGVGSARVGDVVLAELEDIGAEMGDPDRRWNGTRTRLEVGLNTPGGGGPKADREILPVGREARVLGAQPDLIEAVATQRGDEVDIAGKAGLRESCWASLPKPPLPANENAPEAPPRASEPASPENDEFVCDRTTG